MKRLFIAFVVFALTIVVLTTFAVPAMARPPTTAMLSMVANSQTSSGLGLLVISRCITAVPMATAENGPGILTPTAMAANDRELLVALTEVLTQEAVDTDRLCYDGLIGPPGALAYGSTPTLTKSSRIYSMIYVKSIGSILACSAPAAFNDAITTFRIGQRQGRAYYSGSTNMAAIARGNTFAITRRSTVLRNTVLRR